MVEEYRRLKTRRIFAESSTADRSETKINERRYCIQLCSIDVTLENRTMCGSMGVQIKVSDWNWKNEQQNEKNEEESKSRCRNPANTPLKTLGEAEPQRPGGWPIFNYR